MLKEWLPLAVPNSETWLSKEDIEKGSIWFGDIEKTIKETSVGIICLTRENKERPWILFEAGGLNKGLADKSRVCPLLLDLDVRELESPLKEFNAARPDKEHMLALCKMINRQNKVNPLSDGRVETFFDKFWDDFEKKFKALLETQGHSLPPKKKAVPEMVEEILETVQALLRASQEKKAWPSFYGAAPEAPYPFLTTSGSVTPNAAYNRLVQPVTPEDIANMIGMDLAKLIEGLGNRSTPSPHLKLGEPRPPGADQSSDKSMTGGS